MGKPSRRGSMARVLELRWPRESAVVVCGMLGLVLPALFGTLAGVPDPVIQDEFSYLLAADTFAHGRLTNPSPRLPEFFEAPHILVVPTYSSKYPPAPGLFLAIGQVLTGRPIWGVWLGCALFAASLCWMLQAWVSRRWALAITLMAVVTLGTSTYWAQSYWGGMVPAAGAALVFAGVRRQVRSWSASASMLTGVGFVVLIDSRPFEGLLVSIGPGFLLLRRFIRSGRDPHRWSHGLLPAVAVVALAGAFTALHNQSVTGDWHRMPYTLNMDQYFRRGMFLFSPVHEPELSPRSRVSRYYESDAHPTSAIAPGLQYAENLYLRSVGTLGAAFGIVASPRRDREAYRGVLLWLALAIGVVAARTALQFGLITSALIGIEAASWWAFPSAYPVYLLPFAVAPWALFFIVTWRRNRWAVPIAAVVVGVLAAQALVRWWWGHYGAPLVPLILAAVAMAGQRAAAQMPGPRPRVPLGHLLVVLLCLHFTAATALSLVERPTPLQKRWSSASRGAAERHFLSRGGTHLVFVRYADDFSIHDEWVYNPADLTTAPVLFVHDLGERNDRLRAQYADRSAWLLLVSNQGFEVRPYEPDPRPEHTRGTTNGDHRP